MDVSDELEGFKAGFKKNNNGTTDADGTDPSAIEHLALQGKMHRLRKKISPDQVEELDAMSEDALRARIVQCEVNIHESDKAKEADLDLKALKDRLKEAQGPYSDAKKLQTAVAAYCTCRLDELGKA